ncbi:IclR family transcriptional regulator [Roseobacter sp. EG26]|uniref:IclR family transcriptional regulator n=1 Tax=Roseobacter sp. EG26 TaxID=3412477 RepID=UPI003CE5BC02
MTSAVKTLELLTFFSAARPEIGLSQFRRLTGRDKATTYRHLQALEDTGFVEQNPETRRYRLGPAVLQLAQMRERTVPRKTSVEIPLRALAEATGETAHVSVLSGSNLHRLHSVESHQHSTRVVIDLQILPLHATASGICALAFGPEDLMETALSNLEQFTDHTLTTAESLITATRRARDTGFGVADRSLEEEVYSLSAPIFDQSGLLAGAVSVASVATRITARLERVIQENLIAASRQITLNWGGATPEDLETRWSETLSTSPQMESAT